MIFAWSAGGLGDQWGAHAGGPPVFVWPSGAVSVTPGSATLILGLGARLMDRNSAGSVTVFMADSTDHRSGKAGLTLTLALSKAGGAFGSVSLTQTEIGLGYYRVDYTTSETDTLGDWVLKCVASGADDTAVFGQIVVPTWKHPLALSIPNYLALS